MKSPAQQPTKLNTKNTDVKLALVEQALITLADAIDNIEKRFDSIDSKLDKINKDIAEKLQKFEFKFEKIENNITTKLESFNNRLWINFYWILGTMFTLSCAAAGILAKGFGWFEIN